MANVAMACSWRHVLAVAALLTQLAKAYGVIMTISMATCGMTTVTVAAMSLMSLYCQYDVRSRIHDDRYVELTCSNALQPTFYDQT